MQSILSANKKSNIGRDQRSKCSHVCRELSCNSELEENKEGHGSFPNDTKHLSLSDLSKQKHDCNSKYFLSFDMLLRFEVKDKTSR